MEWVCLQAYPKCSRTAASAAFSQPLLYQPPFPSYPCKSVCQNYSVECKNIQSASPRLVPKCNSVGYLSFIDGNSTICGQKHVGLPDWPAAKTDYYYGSKKVTTTCNTLSSAATNISVVCPYPLTETPLWYKEIGRAVQQECRDRSRMPSSA
eukprot:TRINITY_DN10569_c0_g2_i4.p1 TRINITY_DN10569_c0_g2~~TRINITY_DN10569_c0_g2_i4.p1  ORF type:complete len:152 (+),score=4.84 TRINITY_DN10569_c0_g2_i4:38-493(+)